MKMKNIIKTLLLMFLIIPHIATHAQENLVLNGSFEHTIQCPFALGMQEFVADWKYTRHSADYYNRCATNYVPSVPANFFGYQEPFLGDAYIGMFTYAFDTSYTETAGVQLAQPLEIGTKYYVSFRMALSLGPGSESRLTANNKIGIQFFTVEHSQTFPTPINNRCHICTDEIVIDTLNWTLVKGSFWADSAYSYLSLGNFYDKLFVDTVSYGSSSYGAYYYFDDIRVSTDSSFVYSGVQQISESAFSFYPNPASKVITVKFEDNKEHSIIIYNSIGKIILTKSITEESTTDVSALSQGMYYIKANDYSIIKKFIIF